MKKVLGGVILFVLFLMGLGLFAGPAQSQDLIVATGGPKGTYSSFFKSIQLVCGDKVALRELPSAGSDENIDDLINKKADLAFVQTDALQKASMDDPRAGESNIRTLVPLYPEEVHVVALKDLSKVEGGFKLLGKSFGGDKRSLDSLADLAGQKVGAWGGSYTTALIIAHPSGGNAKFEPVQYPDDKSALAALNKGEIAAIIAVGGQPLGFVSGLNGNYKLLKIDGDLAQRVKAYRVARLNYRNIGATGVPTVAATSYLVTKNYASPEKRAELSALKQCIIANETTFKEGTGHHPKWADADFNAATVVSKYETTSAPTVMPAKAKR